jgi:HK97 family phage portal protein
LVRLPWRRKSAEALARTVTWAPGTDVELLRLANLGSLSAIYKSHSEVRTVVDFLARNIAQLGIKVYLKISPAERKPLPDHPLGELLDRPNDDTTRYRLLHGTVSDLAIYDRAYWWKIRRGGRILQLIRVPPGAVTHRDFTMTRPSRFRVTWAGDSRDIPSEDVLYFRGYNPDDPTGGVSPLESLRAILDEETEAVRHQRMLWRNAARMEGVIERSWEAVQNSPWNKEQRQQYREEWQAAMSGSANSGKTAVLEGAHFNPATFSPKEAEYIQGRKLTREEVARAYHIPLPMVGLLDNATFSNITEQHKNLYQDTLGPWLKMLKEEIELQLLPELDAMRGVYIDFNIDEKLKGSFEEQAKAMQTLVGVPVVAVEEGRARLNLAPTGDPDFAKPVKPLNVLYGGQASPTDSAPVQGPSEGPEPIKSELAAVLRAHFQRQAASVKARKGAGADPWFNRGRWDSELTHDLTGYLGHDVARAEALLINASIAQALESKDLDEVFREAVARAGEVAERLSNVTDRRTA